MMKNTLKKIMAILSAALIIFSFSACGAENDDKAKTSTTAVAESVDEETEAVDVDAEEEEETEAEEETEEAEEIEDETDTTAAKKKNNKKTTNKNTNKTTKKSGKKTTKKSTEKTTKKSSDKNTTKKSSSKKTTKKSTEKKTTKKQKSAPSSKKEVVALYNKAANLVKSNKAGYTKHNIKKAEDEVAGAIKFLKGIFENDTTDTYTKGSNDAYNNFPVEGYSFGSKLSADNVAEYSIKESGNNYVIHMEIPKKEINPTKGKGIYGSFISLMDRQDVLDKASAIKDCKITYHDGIIDAKIDKKTNRPVEIKIYAYTDVVLNVLGKDFDVPNIKSGSTYYDFKW